MRATMLFAPRVGKTAGDAPDRLRCRSMMIASAKMSMTVTVSPLFSIGEATKQPAMTETATPNQTDGAARREAALCISSIEAIASSACCGSTLISSCSIGSYFPLWKVHPMLSAMESDGRPSSTSPVVGA